MTLSDSIAARLPKRGSVFWEHKLPPELQAELAEALADFRAGLRGTRTGFSKALAETLTEQGHPISRAGVESWMKRQAAAD